MSTLIDRDDVPFTDPNSLISRADVGLLLNIGPHRLEKWARQGIGPQCYKLGNKACYRYGDILAYIDSIKQQPDLPPPGPTRVHRSLTGFRNNPLPVGNPKHYENGYILDRVIWLLLHHGPNSSRGLKVLWEGYGWAFHFRSLGLQQAIVALLSAKPRYFLKVETNVPAENDTRFPKALWALTDMVLNELVPTDCTLNAIAEMRHEQRSVTARVERLKRIHRPAAPPEPCRPPTP